MTIKIPRHLAVWSGAHAAVKLESYLFDYAFYPYMLYSGGGSLLGLAGVTDPDPQTGYWVGFAILCALSLTLNVAYIRAYDCSRHDWFGFETARRIRPPRFLRALAFLPAAARAAIFLYLSIWHNPLFATLWMRSRERAFSMIRRDWLLFGAAVAFANVGWTVVVTTAVTVLSFSYEGVVL